MRPALHRSCENVFPAFSARSKVRVYSIGGRDALPRVRGCTSRESAKPDRAQARPTD